MPIVLERGTRKGAPVWMNDSSQTSSAAAMHQQTWQSWGLFWHGLFYVSLLIATGLAITVIPRSWQELSVIMGCALLLGIWYMPYLFISAQTFRQHPWRTLSYMSLGWALWLALITQDSDYLFVLFGLYPQVSVFLPFPWSLVGGVVLLALSLWQQLPDLGNGGGIVFFFILSSGVIGICWMLFLNSTFSHNSKQAHLIAQLQAARRELAQAERLAGVMQERQRLAANIHDTVAQGFASIVMALESANMSLLANDESIRPMLERIDRIARESLAETRALLWALQPEVFERASLPEFLLALATRWSEEHGITVQTMITGEVVALRPEIEVTLLRAAQEALANVWKHAQASSVVLTLSYMDEMVVLDVQDDGRGFEAQPVLATARAQSTGGFGLPALRERAEQQGGTLTIESEPGEGTTVALTIPAIPTGPQQEIQEEQ
ncbi:MAG TPA: sensor histidine kinase [Ktedonobacteraceae bacterium]|nr:sensor histidine kinase [Ktedonobacteraceae bacterium]